MELKNTQEAYKWLRENTLLATDTFMLEFEQLAFAIKKGWIIPVGDTGSYITKNVETFWGTYEVQEVYKLPEEVIRENLIIYPYRYKATLVRESEAFKEIDDECVRARLRTADNAILVYSDYTAINNYCKEVGICR